MRETRFFEMKMLDNNIHPDNIGEDFILASSGIKEILEYCENLNSSLTTLLMH